MVTVYGIRDPDTSQRYVVAIEAKHTEPPYPPVMKWSGSSANRDDVLDGRLGLIMQGTGVTGLTASAVSGLPYQMIHR